MNLTTPRKSIVTRTLAPAAKEFFDMPGTSFDIIEADGPLAIGLDDETPESWDVGTGFTSSPGEGFRRLLVQNLSTLPNRVTIIASFGIFRDNRLNFVPFRNVGLPVTAAPTRVKGWPDGSIPANSGIIFDGIFVKPDLIRKALTISNEDTTLKVQVRDPAGNVILVVNGGDSAYLETSGRIEVYNPQGAAIQVRIGEIIYSSNAA
jgi:hypothetical protein